ncbi:MAG TPA: AMP-binding protein [Cyclobacteriaceae bacterium]
MTFLLNGVPYSPDQLKEGQFNFNTPFEESTLAFCKGWLNGKDHFEIQTSGSTGTPKKISFTRKQLEASAKLTETALSLKKEFNALVCLDTKYIAGQMMLVRSLVTGMSIIAVEPGSNPFDQVSSEVQIDFTALVPYQIQAILNSEQADHFNSIQKIIIGGAGISNDLVDELQDYPCSFYATYGMTETISHIALRKLNEKDKQDYFHPLPSVNLRKDERDCLIISAPHVSETEIVTNDIVELNEDQSFKILGRWDNVINSGGVKISPEPVEEKVKNLFNKLQLSNRFFLAGVPDEKLGMKVILVIEGKSFSESEVNKLHSELKKELSKYEIPKEVKFISSFIQTETQKINRKKTLELL